MSAATTRWTEGYVSTSGGLVVRGGETFNCDYTSGPVPVK